jgi:hypothetical protein
VKPLPKSTVYFDAALRFRNHAQSKDLVEMVALPGHESAKRLGNHLHVVIQVCDRVILEAF